MELDVGVLALESSGDLVSAKVEVEEAVEAVGAFGSGGEANDVSGCYVEEGFDEGFGGDTVDLVDDD